MVTSITQKDIIQIGLIVLISYVLVQIGKAIIRRSIHRTYSDVNDSEITLRAYTWADSQEDGF